MGVREQRPARRECVDVRRLDLRMPVQAADPIIQVVDGDDEDVGLVGGRGWKGAREQEERR